MTGPIIPAGEWPTRAVMHSWDRPVEGVEDEGWWTTYDDQAGAWVTVRSGLKMPAGWDWRVPVMRPTCKDSLPVAPAINLEQFRCLADFVLDRSANMTNIKAAYDLLALIDRQASEQPSVAPVGVEGLMQLAREWCMSWGEWAHDADPGCAKENAAEAVLRAALTQALAQQPAACSRCNGTGEADSGGIMPWGAPAMIPCECQQPVAVVVDKDTPWCVPAMRPTIKEYLPVAPAIDLEQFRGAAYEAWRSAEAGSEAEGKINRLLALIDASKNNNLPHVGDINVVVSQPTNGEVGVMSYLESCSLCGLYFTSERELAEHRHQVDDDSDDDEQPNKGEGE